MNDTIDTIKRALEAATPGEWWHFQTNDSIVCDITEPIHMRKTIADVLSRNHADTQLIANSPTWLLYLLGEVERLKGELAAKNEVLAWYSDAKNYDPEHLSKHGYIPIDKDEGGWARSILTVYPSTKEASQ